MKPLPGIPKNFRELVEADLRRAARLIIKCQDTIDWQFRVATPKGDYHLAVTMPDDQMQRTKMLLRIEAFMQWRAATAFTLAAETTVPLDGRDTSPDALYVIGVSKRGDLINCLVPITRNPRPWSEANFGSVVWLPQDNIDAVLIELLVASPRTMTPRLVQALEYWFGASGLFPAVQLPSGEATM